jgi:hypothetical protein
LRYRVNRPGKKEIGYSILKNVEMSPVAKPGKHENKEQQDKTEDVVI